MITPINTRTTYSAGGAFYPGQMTNIKDITYAFFGNDCYGDVPENQTPLNAVLTHLTIRTGFCINKHVNMHTLTARICMEN